MSESDKPEIPESNEPFFAQEGQAERGSVPLDPDLLARLKQEADEIDRDRRGIHLGANLPRCVEDLSQRVGRLEQGVEGKALGLGVGSHLWSVLIGVSDRLSTVEDELAELQRKSRKRR